MGLRELSVESLDTDLVIGKRVAAGRTTTEAGVLGAAERATELAAMPAGQGDEAQAAAAALLRSAGGDRRA
jgi:DNA repair ATPase RecN